LRGLAEAPGVVDDLAHLVVAGVSLFELSRFMGTSPQMLDKTYGHLLPDALERGRAALDSFVTARPSEAFGH
jgi:hypothetical protein